MINLPADIENLVAQHLATGRFASAEDVLRTALEQLDAADLQALRQSVADEEAGNMRPLKEVVAEIRDKVGIAES